LIILLNIISVLLTIVWWIIVVQAVMSWLIAFNVINTYNDTVRAIWQALERLTEPMYRPIRRVLPNLNGLDLSPMVVLVILAILNIILRNVEISVLTGAV
jgi:YggT family protein